MGISLLRGTTDTTLDSIRKGLEAYQADHPDAEIGYYRQNSVSVRIRIVDPSLRGLEREQRHAHFWKYFDETSEEAQSDITMLLLLAPDEVKRSFANVEFDDPVPSQL
jgi:hypothetical protein